MQGVAAFRKGEEVDVVAHQAPGPEGEPVFDRVSAQEIEIDGAV